MFKTELILTDSERGMSEEDLEAGGGRSPILGDRAVRRVLDLPVQLAPDMQYLGKKTGEQIYAWIGFVESVAYHEESGTLRVLVEVDEGSVEDPSVFSEENGWEDAPGF